MWCAARSRCPAPPRPPCRRTSWRTSRRSCGATCTRQPTSTTPPSGEILLLMVITVIPAAGSPSSRPAPSTDTSSRCRPRRCGCPTPSPTPATRPPTPWARRAPPPGRRSQEATSGNTPRTGPSQGSLHTARARSRNPRTNLPQSLGTSASSRGRGGGRAAAAGSGAACRPGPARSSRRPTSGWGA